MLDQAAALKGHCAQLPYRGVILGRPLRGLAKLITSQLNDSFQSQEGHRDKGILGGTPTAFEQAD